MAHHGSPHVYDWGPLAVTGACGVSTSRSRALNALHQAVREAPPGEEGLLHESVLGFHGEYQVLRTIGRVAHDATTRLIVWQEIK